MSSSEGNHEQSRQARSGHQARALGIVQRILRTHLPDRKVGAFGSCATGRAKPYSDMDLAVIGEQPLTLDLSAALSEAFSESDLPWTVVQQSAATHPAR